MTSDFYLERLMVVRTFLLNRSTMYKNTRLPTKVVTEIKSDELFSDNDDPVLLNISVT